MGYAEITFNDSNPVKRWLQRRRLAVAGALAGPLPADAAICDFGAGNGELCKLLASRHPAARLICYEPAPPLLAEARENLAALPQVEFCADLSAVGHQSLDALFCLEVFEHLPMEETEAALTTMHTLLKPRGRLVVGVPVEIGVPALYKGLFRMCRRYGAFDARWGNVLRSLVGRPPHNRPTAEIAPGLRFHFEHTGFDHRQLRAALGRWFSIERTAASPVSLFGPRLMPEVYFLGIRR
jgi:SAM-dependent methyltransferase